MQKSAQPKAIDISNDSITLEPKKSLHDAHNSLVTYNISRIVVAKENKPLGIVTKILLGICILKYLKDGLKRSR